jgi:hypothetical protein
VHDVAAGHTQQDNQRPYDKQHYVPFSQLIETAPYPSLLHRSEQANH